MAKLKKRKKIRLSHVVIHCVFIFLSLCCIVPLLVVLGVSLTEENSLLVDGYHLIPKEFSLDAYKYVFSGASSVLRAYFVTIVVTVAGTFLHLLTTGMLAYALTRKEVTFRNAISFFVFFPMLFSGGLVPSYILMVRTLELKNTWAVLICAGLVAPMNVIIMKNFFRSIPESLIESARLDGASEYRTLFQIVMPLSKPVIATVAMFTAIGYWNNWMQCSLYIEKTDLYMLQYLLQKMMQNVKNIMANIDKNPSMEMAAKALPSEGARMATCIISIGPIILLYPLIQKYFEKGLTVGSVKE